MHEKGGQNHRAEKARRIPVAVRREARLTAGFGISGILQTGHHPFDEIE